MKVKTIKKEAIIDIKISSSFYVRLQALVASLYNNVEDFQDKNILEFHKETMLILMSTLDEEAENQGFVSESDIIPES